MLDPPIEAATSLRQGKSLEDRVAGLVSWED